jgi:aspartate/methionine/tyrosine aminotransferase
VTPAFIRDAAAASLARGETFYAQNLGIPELRQAIAGYVSALHAPVDADEIVVTATGMSALMITVEALVSPGDRVVVVTPLWPNLTEIPKILGANVECVPLAFGASGWTLDVDRLLDALTPDTRVLLLNSPNNPTGWTIDRASQQALLAHCARHGIWIVADDVYERLHYAGAARAAPSLLEFADRDARVVSTNSFSKAWLMTGWRLGWIVAPRALVPDLGKLVEYNTSCSPVFVQRGGVVALRDGEPTVAATRARLRHARDRLVAALRTLPRVDVAPPAGAMYAFFRIDGMTDSVAFCKALVHQAKLGLAPGRAFGPEGEGFVRWCFAASDERLDEGVARLAHFLEARCNA